MAVAYYAAVWDMVRQIPPGKVMCYGQIATLLGTPRGAQGVGDAMFHAVDEVPWQRVINKKGEISLGGHPDRPRIQRELLEAEGVEFDERGRVDLKRNLWWPEGSSAS